MNEGANSSARFRTALVLGGARSGKSRFAQGLAERARANRIFVATAQAGDEEMRLRIDRHRRERGAGWSTVETPTDLAAVVARESRQDFVLLVDCITLWLSNLMAAGRDPEKSVEQLIRLLPEAPGPVILVSNEIGLGLVPETALGREFRDCQGRANQRIAAACELAIFVAAGCPMQLKPALSGAYLAK